MRHAGVEVRPRDATQAGVNDSRYVTRANKKRMKLLVTANFGSKDRVN
jgi:hypothetical protein